MCIRDRFYIQPSPSPHNQCEHDSDGLHILNRVVQIYRNGKSFLPTYRKKVGSGFELSSTVGVDSKFFGV